MLLPTHRQVVADPNSGKYKDGNDFEVIEHTQGTVAVSMDMGDAEEVAQYQCVTVVLGAGAGPGEIDENKPERFLAMEAAAADADAKKRSAHYDEFQKLQEYKRKLAAGELTEDDY